VKRATVSADGETITVHIPFTFRKRGGRKLVVTPDGASWAPRPRVDNAMVKALARAFRWRRMLDEGVHATLEDLTRAKGVAPSCVSRVLRLTLLAPDIVEAILDGRQPAGPGAATRWSRRWRGRSDGSVCWTSVCATIEELAERVRHPRARDGGGPGPGERCRAVQYDMSRILWLTLLAPEIVEAILDGRPAWL
jgi:hypothetical protein